MEEIPTFIPQHVNAEPDHHAQGDLRDLSQDLQDISDLQGSLNLDIEQSGLTSEMKSLLNKIYKLGHKRLMVESHARFLEICKVS